MKNNPTPVRKKPGRKALPDAVKVRSLSSIRCRPREWSALERMAKAAGETLARNMAEAEAARLLLLDQLARLLPAARPAAPLGRPPRENKTRQIVLSVNAEQMAKIRELQQKANCQNLTAWFLHQLKKHGG